MILDINQAIFRIFIGAVIGAIIGLEREKSMELNKENSPIGIRTDILVGILGAVSVYLSQLLSPWIFIITLISVIIIGLLPILQNHNTEKLMSYKTSISLVIIYLMGGLAFHGEIQVALAVAIISTFVLSIKSTLHKFIYGLDYGEIIDASKFLIIAFIILPFLPNKAYDGDLLNFFDPPAVVQTVEQTNNVHLLNTDQTAMQSLSTNPKKIETNIINPYRIWLLIVIISGLNFLGYILVKLYGQKKAYSITGFIGGFYSSTVTSLNLATNSKNHTDLIAPFVTGIILACGSSFFKLLILIRTLNSSLFERALPSLLAMMIYLLGVGGITHFLGVRQSKKSEKKDQKELVKIKSPLNLKSAIKLAFFVIATMLVANIILKYADISLYYILAAAMAFLSVDDPIIISTADIAGKAINFDIAKNIIIGVIFLNMIQKVATVFLFGNRKLIKPLALAFSGLFLVTILAFLYL
ncbi:DUF4010 domain-containing protein [Candidatus Peregrinibacteria bacterium]|nr:DUF4010 domain-containing protein [Candidatus Peregrinibacteria bacterium]